MDSIIFQYFPKSNQLPDFLDSVLSVFKNNYDKISSNEHEHRSNVVLHTIQNDLQSVGFVVKSSQKSYDKISIPVILGSNDKIIKSFDVDALNVTTRTVIDVEAGRGVLNNEFLKDLIEACMMHNVDYLVIAIRKIYKDKKDFESVKTFFETLFSCRKLSIPLKGILIIGY